MKILSICKICKKEIWADIPRTYCSIKCRTKDVEWIGKVNRKKRQQFRGTAKQIYNLVKRRLKEANIKLVCSNCGSSNRIHIHHIDLDRLNNSINNLMPLCNSCHNKAHHWEQCPKCGRLKPNENHKCPDKNEYRIYAIKNISERERCPKCGKLFGFDKSKHSCRHPRGMKGKKHSKETIERIKQTLKIRMVKKND